MIAAEVEPMPTGDIGGHLSDRFEVLVRDAHRLLSRTLEKRIKQHGVSIGQWHFLRVLWEEQGLSQREVSHRVGMREPTTATTLQGMERVGLVRRVRDPGDIRRVNVYLTERGEQLASQLLPYVPEVNGIASSNLSTDEIGHLESSLEKMVQSLRDRAGK